MLDQEYFDGSECADYVREHRRTLNDAQSAAYRAICGALWSDEWVSKAFFVDGPGGTGKTYLFKLLLNEVRQWTISKNDPAVALAVATSGVAALLLPGGRTAHSRFRIPLNITEKSVLPIPPCSPLGMLIGEVSAGYLMGGLMMSTLHSAVGMLIKRARLIVWDEAPMAHRLIFEAFDRLLKDLAVGLNKNLPFGGKVVVFGGDFRQVLPVVVHGGRADQVNACFTQSTLWKYVRTLELTVNMRVAGTAEPAFAEWLLRIGDGTEPSAR